MCLYMSMALNLLLKYSMDGGIIGLLSLNDIVCAQKHMFYPASVLVFCQYFTCVAAHKSADRVLLNMHTMHTSVHSWSKKTAQCELITDSACSHMHDEAHSFQKCLR